jgi:beta-galactosidase/beta-glucuronidase
MSLFRRNAVFAVLAVFIAHSFAAAADWKPAPGKLMTAWAAKVDPNHPLPEYPRPQMVRDTEWTNLNGLWNYEITDLGAAKPEKYDGKILVPFCVESALSGVMKPLTEKQWLWYRRDFTAPKLADGKRLLLHFSAVDWEAVVTVNGKEVGTHRGGYDPFTFDITDAIKAGSENELVVRVADSTGRNGEPHGKQSFAAINNPGGIFYTPCSGMWQTVWLEVVPEVSIESLVLVPDIDAAKLHVTVNVRGNADGISVSATPIPTHVSGREPMLETAVEKTPGQEFDVNIHHPTLWSPERPYLYNLKVVLMRSGKPVDGVSSYFAMRKISVAKDEKGVMRLMLNNKPVFQFGPLDQGFWPDGIYTAPTDDALKSDIEAMKKLGFNMVRKHVKVEPDRWYYWCDKLGLLVWQDMPSGGAGSGSRRRGGQGQDGVPASAEKAKQFEEELKAMIETHRNHPSIVMWVVFNEGWGQYDTSRLTKWVKEFDPSRLVNDASGWTDRQVGDVIDMHKYPGPGSPDPEASRAAVLGEFGGLGLPVDGHRWVTKNWGYRGMADQQELNQKYLDLWKGVAKLRDEKGLSAAVYTQLTDVETECNGLMTYDRAVTKVDVSSLPALTSVPKVTRDSKP